MAENGKSSQVNTAQEPMNRHTYSALIIFFFLLTIIVPLALADKKGGKVAVDENRYLSVFPSISSYSELINRNTWSAFEGWLKDNLFWRGQVIELQRILEYRLFDVPSFNSPIVKEGKEDWLFLLPQYDIPQVVNYNLPTTETIEHLKSKFASLTTTLKKRDIELAIMIWPRKYDVYPEKLPSTLRPVNEKNGLQILDENLSSETSFDFRTPLKELIARKPDFPTYSKAADPGHWNAYGAFIGYSQLMQQIKAHIPDINILTEKDFDITQVMVETKYPWGFTATEQDKQYLPRYVPQSINDNDYFVRIGFESQDPWKSYNYYSNPNINFPKAIIIGDSFTWLFLLPKLSESFSELAFIYKTDISDLDLLIENIHPDIIILAGQGQSSAFEFADLEFPPLKE